MGWKPKDSRDDRETVPSFRIAEDPLHLWGETVLGGDRWMYILIGRWRNCSSTFRMCRGTIPWRWRNCSCILIDRLSNCSSPLSISRGTVPQLTRNSSITFIDGHRNSSSWHLDGTGTVPLDTWPNTGTVPLDTWRHRNSSSCHLARVQEQFLLSPGQGTGTVPRDAWPETGTVPQIARTVKTVKRDQK